MGIGTAMIGAAALLAVAYLNSFVAEIYRRFLDSTTLAAALAGELKSHFSAFPVLNGMFDTLLVTAKAGSAIPLRRIPTPTDPIFDAAATKIGLLGTTLARDTVYIYEQLRAFRIAMDIIAEFHQEMESAELEHRLTHCKNIIGNSTEKIEQLIGNLEEFAQRKFVKVPQGWVSFIDGRGTGQAEQERQTGKP